MGNDAVWRNPAKGLRVCNGRPLKGLRVRSHLKRLGVLKEEETGINFSYFDEYGILPPRKRKNREMSEGILKRPARNESTANSSTGCKSNRWGGRSSSSPATGSRVTSKP